MHLYCTLLPTQRQSLQVLAAHTQMCKLEKHAYTSVWKSYPNLAIWPFDTLLQALKQYTHNSSAQLFISQQSERMQTPTLSRICIVRTNVEKRPASSSQGNPHSVPAA
jgi:hypothetical protein